MNNTKESPKAPIVGSTKSKGSTHNRVEKIPGYVTGIKGVASGVASWQGTANLAPANAKYTVAVDYFEVILEASDELVNYDVPLDKYDYALGKIHLEKLPYGTKHFAYGYEVFLHSRAMGTLFCSPRNKEGVLKATNMQFKLKNNLFYEVGWLDDVKFLFTEMKWTVRNVTRLDIAIDGKGFFGTWNKYKSGKINRRGDATQSERSDNVKGRPVVSSFYVGSMASDKFINCYNKTEELKSSGNKNYIHDFHKRAGLDTRRVERLEIRMRNGALKLLCGFMENIIDGDGKIISSTCEGWKKLDDYSYLASIARTFIDEGNLINVKTGEVKQSAGLLVFVIPDSQKNQHRKRKVTWINWGNLCAVPLDRLSAIETTEVWRMKQTAKTLVWLSESCKQFKSKLAGSVDQRIEEDKYRQRGINFLNEAYEVAASVNCLGWLRDRYENWVESYSKKKLKYLPKFQLASASLNFDKLYCYEWSEAELHLKK